MDRHIRKAKKKAEGALKEVFSRSYIVEKIDRYWRYCYKAYMRALWKLHIASICHAARPRKSSP